mmetsp:Transcript_4756/g.11995  ORF Transcript_4756/g.11995 Transcript_4756/m.11995 type:complete len:308 (+) Transcript_4756:407-1330(+)
MAPREVPTPGCNATREIAAVLVNIIRNNIEKKIMSYASEVVTSKKNPTKKKKQKDGTIVIGGMETEGERLQKHLQVLRVIGQVDLRDGQGLFEKLQPLGPKTADWTVNGLLNSFFLEFLRYAYGVEIIDALFPDGLVVKEVRVDDKDKSDDDYTDGLNTSALMRLKFATGTHRELNEIFFKHHNLDINVFIAKMRACFDNPQVEFPNWIRLRGWEDVLLTTPAYLPPPLPPRLAGGKRDRAALQLAAPPLAPKDTRAAELAAAGGGGGGRGFERGGGSGGVVEGWRGAGKRRHLRLRRRRRRCPLHR